MDKSKLALSAVDPSGRGFTDKQTDHEFHAHQKFMKERDKILANYELQALGPNAKLAKERFQEGWKKAEALGYHDRVMEIDTRFVRLGLTSMNILGTGVRMEDVDKLLKAVNMETQNSAEILKRLLNEVRTVGDAVEPELLNMLKEIRSTRMTIVSELTGMLTALREVRKFFLESDYSVEMERLERFVRLCEEIKRLKTEGVFDSVVDSAIRLAIKEEDKK